MANDTNDELQATQAQVDATEEDLEAQLAYQNLMHKREARRRKRIIAIVAVAVVALLGVLWLAVGATNQDGDDVEIDPLAATTVVYRGDFATTITASGATEPLASTVVTPEVDGIIENLQVQEGQQVNEGDVLFTLKNESLDKEVSEANSQVDQAQRTVNSANQAVDDAYAVYQREWDNCNASGDWSTFDETSLRAQITSAESSYSDAVAALDRAKTERDETQARADKRTVRAPVSGTIVQMDAQNGAGVGSAATGQGSGSGTLMQISDLSQMKVTVQVNEVDIASIAEGQQAKATFSALPGVELDATVQHIASVSTGGATGEMGGVVTYAVDLLIPEPDPNLKPGMTATVSITTQSSPDSLIVPSSAIWDGMNEEGQAQQFVTVATTSDDGTELTGTRDVPLTVIVQNQSEAAVEAELEEGDLVILGAGGGEEEALVDDAGMDLEMAE